MISDASDKLAGWRTRLYKFEFEVVHRAGIKHQAVDAMSTRWTKSASKTFMDDEILIPALSKKSFEVEKALEPKQEKKKEENTGGNNFMHGLPGIIALANQIPENEANVQKLFEFIAVQALDSEYKHAVDTVEKPNWAYAYNTVQMASQWERRWYESMRR